jgi:hypothetical protein
MGIGPKVTLTGNADKFIWVYGAMIGLVALVGIYLLGRSTGKSAAIVTVTAEPIVTSNLSYPNSQYLTYADSLQSCLESFLGFGVDVDGAYNVFRAMKNNDDVRQLTAAFGTRRPMWDITSINLSDWLHMALSNSSIQGLNQILMANNITVQF